MVAAMDGVLEVKMSGKRRQVVGVMIQVMPVTGLRRAAMSATVVSYDSIAVIEKKHHLRVPIIGRQRPAVAKTFG
jgi:hypothetical protein